MQKSPRGLKSEWTEFQTIMAGQESWATATYSGAGPLRRRAASDAAEDYKWERVKPKRADVLFKVNFTLSQSSAFTGQESLCDI